MKEYVKPTVEVVDIKIKDDVTADPVGITYGDTITYYVLDNRS